MSERQDRRAGSSDCLVASSGKQTCGQKHGNWHEERIPAKCTGDVTGNGQFKVRVYTTLNSGATDESFGIDNAVVKQLTSTGGGGMKTITANFQNTKDQQGWNCGKITNCGSFGNICGGYNVKGKSHDIQKTFKGLSAGKYQIALDFIKIDSWFVEDRVA